MIHDADTGQMVSYTDPIQGGDWVEIELAPLPPGAYRITVGEDAPVESASDIFVTTDGLMSRRSV